MIPKSLAEHANALGIHYHRMVTTGAGLRVEYLNDRIYAVPSAHDELDRTPSSAYPHLGYLVRFGAVTIYQRGAPPPLQRNGRAIAHWRENTSFRDRRSWWKGSASSNICWDTGPRSDSNCLNVAKGAPYGRNSRSCQP